jgi:hypothetical protein
MEIATLLKSTAASVVAVGAIAGGVMGADARYAPASTVSELKSELRVDRIFRIASEAQASGSPAWLCEALERELVLLCTEQPDNYLCGPDARREIKAKAGCG